MYQHMKLDLCVCEWLDERCPAPGKHPAVESQAQWQRAASHLTPAGAHTCYSQTELKSFFYNPYE